MHRLLLPLVVFVALLLLVLVPSTFASPHDVGLSSLKTSDYLSPQHLRPLLDPPTATDLAEAMGIPTADIVSASLNGSDPLGTAIFSTPLGWDYPLQATTFTVLSTGNASQADDIGVNPNTNLSGADLVQLALQLEVPETATCAGFNFTFLSEEYWERSLKAWSNKTFCSNPRRSFSP